MWNLTTDVLGWYSAGEMVGHIPHGPVSTEELCRMTCHSLSACLLPVKGLCQDAVSCWANIRSGICPVIWFMSRFFFIDGLGEQSLRQVQKAEFQ